MVYIGVDEVGTGALAGPIVAGAICAPVNLPFRRLREFWPLSRIKDSKKTKYPARKRAIDDLMGVAGLYGWGVGVGIVEVSDIERLGHRSSTDLALAKAVHAASEDCALEPEVVVIDGNVEIPRRLQHTSYRQVCVPKGDSLYWHVAAGSILAKWVRDLLLRDLEKTCPGYGLGQHKGYGTKEHTAALQQLGLVPGVHRPCASRRLHA